MRTTMPHSRVMMLMWVFAVLLGIGLVTPAVASAHKLITVGNYAIEMGFEQEPALQGDLNGLYLSVTDSSTGKPVTGLANTLKAEIQFGTAIRTLPLEPQDGQGAYIAWVVPTEVGSYTWRVFGTIGGSPVDVSASSGADSFNEVQPQSALTFPGTGTGLAGVSATDLSQELIAVRDRADAAASAASAARWIALAGVVLGIAGLLVGGIVARRR